jgi:hypothetical protein
MKDAEFVNDAISCAGISSVASESMKHAAPSQAAVADRPALREQSPVLPDLPAGEPE